MGSVLAIRESQVQGAAVSGAEQSEESREHENAAAPEAMGASTERKK